MNDQLFCVDDRCNLSQKLISTWINFYQHQELEHKMLTIKQFKSYLIQKQSIDGPQFKDQRKNQYLTQSQEQLNLLFDSIESRIQQIVKQELKEIYDLCLKDLEIKIENCIINDIINLDNFETYFQYEEYQGKCLNFYNNHIQIQIHDIINQFCKLKDTQFEDIFESLSQSFFHQKYLLQQVEVPKINPSIQQQKKENQDYKKQEQYFQYKEYPQEGSKQESLLPLKGYKQIEQIQQDYFQQNEYTQQFKSDVPLTQKGNNQIDQIQQEYFQYKEYPQESLLPLKGYKQVEKVQQDHFQYKEYVQESKPETTITKNQIIIQDPIPQTNNQKPKKKLMLSSKKKQNQVIEAPKMQNPISEKVQDVKIPLFKQINGKVEYFTPQLMNGDVQLLDNFKIAKSQSGFILFDGFFKNTASIKVELLILEIDKQSEIEIGLIVWSNFKFPRETGKPQKGIYSLNNKGIQFKDQKQKNREKIFQNQTKLKINISNNKQLSFIGEKTTGFEISELNGDLSLYAYLQNGQIQIIS